MLQQIPKGSLPFPIGAVLRRQRGSVWEFATVLAGWFDTNTNKATVKIITPDLDVPVFLTGFDARNAERGSNYWHLCPPAFLQDATGASASPSGLEDFERQIRSLSEQLRDTRMRLKDMENSQKQSPPPSHLPTDPTLLVNLLAEAPAKVRAYARVRGVGWTQEDVDKLTDEAWSMVEAQRLKRKACRILPDGNIAQV